MTTTHQVSTLGGTQTVHLKGNRHPRPLVSYRDLPPEARAEFDYVADAFAEGYDTTDVPRFFQYRGSWYDDCEFEPAPDWIKALGYDTWQTESAFSAVVVTWFTKDGDTLDDEIIVGYIYW